MNRTGSLNNKEQMEEMTQKSIESRKANGNKAGKKQAVTLVMKNAFFDCPSRSTYKNKHLKASAVDYIIEQMFGKGGEWCKEFIESQLQEAKNNPNSRAADRLAGGLFNEALWDQLDIYLNKANADDVGYELYKIRETLFDRQQEVFDDKQDKRILIINSRRSGKCWSPETLLRKFDGSLVRADSVQVGDLMMGPDNKSRRVVSVTRGMDNMYLVQGSKGGPSFKCNSCHVLTLLRSRNPVKGYKVGELYDFNLQDVLNMSTNDLNSFKLIRQGIEYKERNHFIDSYLFGYWLGDGCSSQFAFTVGKKEQEAIDYFSKLRDKSEWGECSHNSCWFIYLKGYKRELERLGVLNNKRIPQEYLIDSRANRLALLAGLIDSDGWKPREGSVEFDQTKKELFDDVVELVHSLGFHTSVRYNKVNNSWQLQIKGLLSEIPNLISRKHSNNSKQGLGYSFRIIPIGWGEYAGFTLDGKDGRCLLADYTVTHNTELLGRLALKNLISVPDAHVVYLNRTSAAAIRQIRGPLESALKNSNLRIIKGSVESQELHFSNGSQMLILGNNNASDIDKLRGERISLCILDECGHQRNMAQLVREVISPALMDYENSQLVMVGTPPRIPHTFVEQCYNNPNWKKHAWTFMDNPFIPNKEEVLRMACEEAGVEENSAFIQREYFGRMDAFDDDAKWIKKYSIVENEQWNSIKDRVWDYCWVGVDWGFEDLGAIITVLGSKIDNRAYVVESWSKAKTGVKEKADEIKRQLKEAEENYKLARKPVVICDSNNKEANSDLFHVYEIKNVFSAYKYDKDLALDQLADFLASNKISFLKDRSDSLITDCENTLWKRDEETDKILHEIDDDIWHPNALMALLYISRQFAIDVLNKLDINRQIKKVVDELNEETGVGI